MLPQRMETITRLCKSNETLKYNHMFMCHANIKLVKQTSLLKLVPVVVLLTKYSLDLSAEAGSGPL